MKKGFIVGGGRMYEQMFEARGWQVVTTPREADLLQFTGGADVTPSLYGEASHPTTHSSYARDKQEIGVYENYAGVIPMAGICRGGQFLNVINGGTLYQDVNNHAIGGSHAMKIEGETRVIQVTSTHHQMMREGENGNVLAYAHRATIKENMLDGKVFRLEDDEPDVEVVYYNNTKSLCFQPHPEFPHAPKECTDYYFELLGEIV